MKVEIIKTYPDKELRRDVKKGEIITVSEDRGKFLIEKGKAINITFDLELKIADLEAMITEKDKTIAALEAEKADYIAAKDAKIMELETMIVDLQKK